MSAWPRLDHGSPFAVTGRLSLNQSQSEAGATRAHGIVAARVADKGQRAAGVPVHVSCIVRPLVALLGSVGCVVEVSTLWAHGVARGAAAVLVACTYYVLVVVGAAQRLSVRVFECVPR